LVKKINSIDKIIQKVNPNMDFRIGTDYAKKKHLKELIKDPSFYGRKNNSQNIALSMEAAASLEKDSLFDEIVTPTLILKCGKDTVISNE
jgi:hypothetical protein